MCHSCADSRGDLLHRQRGRQSRCPLLQRGTANDRAESGSQALGPRRIQTNHSSWRADLPDHDFPDAQLATNLARVEGC